MDEMTKISSSWLCDVRGRYNDDFERLSFLVPESGKAETVRQAHVAVDLKSLQSGDYIMFFILAQIINLGGRRDFESSSEAKS